MTMPKTSHRLKENTFLTIFFKEIIYLLLSLRRSLSLDKPEDKEDAFVPDLLEEALEVPEVVLDDVRVAPTGTADVLFTIVDKTVFGTGDGTLAGEIFSISTK